MRYAISIFLILLILTLTGCSNKEKDLNNMKLCQESCLSKNMSFNSLTSFNDNSTSRVLQCTCNSYVEVKLSIPIVGSYPDIFYPKQNYTKELIEA